MSTQVNLYEAKAKLSELVDRAMAGEEIVVAKSGKPKVRLVPVKAKPVRKFGLMKGEVWMSEDFDEPLPDEVLDRIYGPLEP